MIKDKSDSIKRLEELKFPNVFMQIQYGETSEIIRDSCASPTKFYRYLSADQLPECEFWLPLWEFEGEELNAYDMWSAKYLRYEYSRKSYRVVANNYQQFITLFFMELVHAGLDDCLEELAVVFAYKHLDTLMAFAEIDHGSQFQSDFDALMLTIG